MRLARVLALAALWVSPVGVRAAEVPFLGQPWAIATVASPRSVSLADVDGDGDPDLVSASFDDSLIEWHENVGGTGASWSSHSILSGASGASSVFVADVDGDGDADVVSASSLDDSVVWNENTAGDGSSWTPHSITTTAGGVSWVSAVDVDVDGDVDVVSASPDDDTIGWYENTSGDGTAWTAHTVAGAAADPCAVVAADVDRDGDPDIVVVSSSDDTLSWHENEAGDGSSWTARTIAMGADACTLYAADIDGDGDVDVASASTANDTVSWNENTAGDGSAWSSHAVTTSAEGVRSVYVTDVDSDGDSDVLSASFDDATIAWHENTVGDGSAWKPGVLTATAAGAVEVLAGDVDRDGDRDVLWSSASGETVVWHENRTIHRSAVFPAEVVITTNVLGTENMFAADVDGDGDIDALSVSFDDDKVAWYENTAADGSAWTAHTISVTADGARSVAAGDIDGDGDVDAVSSSLDDHEITWYENQAGDGSVWGAGTVTTSAFFVSSIFIADVDGDGDLDVLSAAWNDKITWYENVAGDGSAWNEWTISTTPDVAWMVVAADVDGDGALDVLTASGADNRITWFRNAAGDGTVWVERTITDTPFNPAAVGAADVDGDGDVDAVSASHDDDAIAWYENTAGDGSAWRARTIATGLDGAGSVFTEDLDLDGDIDVLSVAGNVSLVSWHENAVGDGTVWLTHTITTNAIGAQWVVAADVDRDGDPDALSASRTDSKIAWYPNRGGQFGVSAVDTAPAVLEDGQVEDLLSVAVTHNGRPGDADLELVSLEMMFENVPPPPNDHPTNLLTSAEADAMFRALTVYGDDGSGAFEETDTPVLRLESMSLVDGWQEFVFADGDPDVRIAHGSPATFFIGAEMRWDAGIQPVRMVGAEFSAKSVTAEDLDHDVVLAREAVIDASVGPFGVAGSYDVDAGSVPDGASSSGGPLVLDRVAGGDLALSWSPSCTLLDADYAIYEGQIGDFTSHVEKTCGTGGATTATVSPAAGDRYYLVVALSANREGSYGRGSAGDERPQAALACRPRAIGGCPWQQVGVGLQGAFGTIDQHYARTLPPDTQGLTTWSGTAWRGERVAAEIVLWTADGAADVSVSTTDLEDGTGNLIPAASVTPHFLHYVLADDGVQGCFGNQFQPTSWIPDVLDTAAVVDVEPQTVQPVWLSVDVPPDTVAADYQGDVVVSWSGGSMVFTLNVEVLDIVLPDWSQWEFHHDLFQNPWSVARYHDVVPWSQEHWDLLDPVIRLLAETGQKTITTTILDRAWGSQTYDDFRSMVEWTKHTDGSWSFDYTIFDQYVEFCMDRGITEQIHAFSLIPWFPVFYYYDEASGSEQSLVLLPGTPAYTAHVQPFLTDFVAHLTQKGWLTRTHIAFDERPAGWMNAAHALIDAASPELQITLYSWEIPASEDDVDEWSKNGPSGLLDLTALAQQRRATGQNTTWYLCCGPPTPNSFTYSPPAENTWIGWYTAAGGFDGAARWAYNSWVEDPLVDTRHWRFPAGDTFQIYPGPRSSVRFERRREGIQDFEKIRILRGILPPDDLTALDNVLNLFIYPTQDYTAHVNQAKGQLDSIVRDYLAGN